VFLIGHFGWRSPFMVFAVVGILWAIFWFWYYRDTPKEHKSVNEAEVELITTSLGRKDSKVRKAVPWGQILSHPQTWLLAFMYFFYGCCIGVYLSWFPKYLVDAHNVTLTQMGLYASLPLLAGVGGDVLGGWLSDIMAKGGNLKMARRLVAVFGFLLAAVMMVLACSTADPMIAVPFFCGAVFGLELTVGVSWAVALDIGDEFAGSVSAVMNTSGNLGSTVAVAAAGYIVTAYGWNTEFYVLAGAAVIAALAFLVIDASKKVYREAPAAGQPAI
jgi:sugar phosphate permease